MKRPITPARLSQRRTVNVKHGLCSADVFSARAYLRTIKATLQLVETDCAQRLQWPTGL